MFDSVVDTVRGVTDITEKKTSFSESKKNIYVIFSYNYRSGIMAVSRVKFEKI